MSVRSKDVAEHLVNDVGSTEGGVGTAIGGGTWEAAWFARVADLAKHPVVAAYPLELRLLLSGPHFAGIK